MGNAKLADTLEPTTATTAPKLNFRKLADVAYIYTMTAKNRPAIGSIEHRAIILLRNFYPTARKNGKANKLRVAKQAAIRRLKKEYGTAELPQEVWRKTIRGMRKMTDSLNSPVVFEAALYDYAIPNVLLKRAVDELLVLPETGEATRSLRQHTS